MSGVAGAVEPVFSAAKAATNGFVVHEVQSEFQSGSTKIYVRVPTKLRAEQRVPVLYLLPVEARDEGRWGSALAEAEKLIPVMSGDSSADDPGAQIDRAAELQKLFSAKPGDTEVRLRLEKPRDFSVILDITAKVRPDKEFKAEVARICGAEAMEVLAG